MTTLRFLRDCTGIVLVLVVFWIAVNVIAGL